MDTGRCLQAVCSKPQQYCQKLIGDLINILQHLLIAKGNTHNINANSFLFLLFKHPQERHLPLNLALG